MRINFLAISGTSGINVSQKENFEPTQDTITTDFLPTTDSHIKHLNFCNNFYFSLFFCIYLRRFPLF